MSGSYVRRLAAFYEVEGQFAVPKSQAEAIVDTSVRIVQQHTGRIALTGIQGARIAIPENPLSVDRLRLGSERHTLLLTNRAACGSEDNDLSRPEGAFVGGVMLPTKDDAGRIVQSKVLVSTIAAGHGSVIDEAIEVAVHELGHSWGIEEHCKVGECVMQAISGPGVRDRLISGRPFCDDCAENLEIAGYQALATQLGR